MIPEGWERTTIGAHVDVLTGYAFKSSDYSSGPDDIRLLRGDNVAQHRIRWRDAQKLPQEKARGLDRFALRLGDFVIALDRTWIPAGVKIAEITEADLPSLLVQRVARLRSKPSLEQSLMRQFFSGHGFEQYVKSVQTETAVPHISPNDLRNLAILLPPLPEQKRMAETLETWDRAIETVEALIANARALKQALMQQLLPQGITPPRKRLPGFSGEWHEIRLGAAFSERVERGDNQLPLLSVTQANGVIPQSEAGRRNISSDDQSNYKTVRAGDIAYNTMRMWQGASALSTLTGKVSPAYTIVTPRKGHDALFYAYLFKQPKMIHVFERHSQGLVSDTWNLKYPHFAKIRTCVPDIEEQRAIAAAFASLDDSTRAYEAQLTALRQEKAALMQQLLTGKRRVKLPENSAQESDAA